MDPRSETPCVALLDDGELDDVRAALHAIAVPHCDARRATIGETVPVLLSTPERARALAAGRAEAPPRQLHAVVAAEASDLDAPGDLALLRPLETSVLRLLARREAHGFGRERRLATRVAMGLPVKVRVGGDCREVVVSRMSIGGCGLISPARLCEGASLEIELPPEVRAGRSLLLTGRVVGSREVTTADGDTYDVSVAFDALELVDRVTLRALMARHAIDFRPETSVPSGRPELRLRRHVVPTGRERRRDARRRFQQRVMGVRDGVGLVLMAHDLSLYGLRIEPSERLAVGDELQLAIFASPETAPLLARALIDRFDDVEGSFLRFVGLGGETSRRIEALLETLAPVDLDPPRR